MYLLLIQPHYPSIINDGSCNRIEPSIRGRQLYIPIDAWFCGEGKQLTIDKYSISRNIYIKLLFALFVSYLE